MKTYKRTGEVKQYKGRPTIFINDTPEPPMIYALTDTPGGRWSWDELAQHNIKRFYESGIKIFQLDIFLEQLFFENGTIDFEPAKKQIRGVLDICPDAAVIFRFHVNAPKWWIEKNPDECVKYDGVESAPDDDLSLPQIIQSDARNCRRFSLASEKWIEYSSEKLIIFCKEFSKCDEANALIGIQIACGIYGEWHYWGFLKWEADLSKPMTNYFKKWLKHKYKSTSNLRKAWNEPNITFDSITVPDTKEREITSAGIFRDPEKERKVIDYYNCQHEVIANDIIHFCRIVKEYWPHNIITGTFYGYYFSTFNRMAAGGHLQLEKILNSKYIDYLSAPQVYEPECYLSGEPYRSRSLIHSVLLHKKLWLDEMDQEPKRTLSFINGWQNNSEKHERTIRENTAQIIRNTMFTHSKGMGLWYYDFGIAGVHTYPDHKDVVLTPNRGYWDHNSYMKSIQSLKHLADKTMNKKYESEADVLLVYDTEVMYYLKSTGKGDPLTRQIVDELTLNTFYSGVIFDPILLSDLDKVNIEKYKIIVFANTFLLKEKDKKIINRIIKKGNWHILWIYAPGYTNGEKIKTDFINEITGFNLKLMEYNKIPSIKISKTTGKFPELSLNDICSPLFYINDINNIEILGNYKHNNKAAFGLKRNKDYTSWFIGLPPNDYRLLKFIYQSAGANIYCDNKDIVYGGSGIITFHTGSGGKKQIKLKTGKVIKLDLPDEPATILIDSETGEIIIP
jgi:hypothetical protein